MAKGVVSAVRASIDPMANPKMWKVQQVTACDLYGGGIEELPELKDQAKAGEEDQTVPDEWEPA